MFIVVTLLAPMISRTAINVNSAAIKVSIMLVTLIAGKDYIQGLSRPVSWAANVDSRTVII